MSNTCIKTQHLETLSSGFPTATVERGERSWFLKGEKLLPYLWTRNLHLCNLWSRHWNKTANIQCKNILIWFRVQPSLSAAMLPTCLNSKGLHSLGCALSTRYPDVHLNAHFLDAKLGPVHIPQLHFRFHWRTRRQHTTICKFSQATRKFTPALHC